MSVEEKLIKALIIKYDESIRLQRKLFDCGFAEALLNIIPINMRNQEALENLLNRRVTECKQLKKYLETSREKVSKLFTKHESNAHLKKFLDFAFFLSTSHDPEEDIDADSNSGAKNILQYYGNGISLKDKSTGELNRNDTGNYHESKGVGLQFYELVIDLMSKSAIANEKNPDTCDEISSKPGNENDDKENNKSPIVGLEEKRNGESKKIGNSSGESQSNISNFCCDICGKIYSSKSYFRYHKRRVHNKERLYGCSKCDKRFKTNSHLRQHARMHDSKKPFKCSVCNEGFKRLAGKRTHERNVHEGNYPLQCAHCDRRFGNKDGLISHLHNQHFFAFRKQFACRICKKSFIFKQGLEDHKLMHTRKKPFKCSVCDQYFKNIKCKNTHERRFHGKDVRYSCDHCGIGYWLKINLIHHLRIEHSE